MSNATRLISAYNKIDKALRDRHNFKPSLTFTDVVRRSAAGNALVRKYEDELLSYARLRNAIVHNSDDSRVIAEPHDDVTEHIERIAEILSRPPRAALFAHKAACCEAEKSLSDVMALMTRGDYSNVPVLRNRSVIGVVTNKMIVHALQKNAAADLNAFIRETPVERILTDAGQYYQIADMQVTADRVLAAFSENRKLAIMILTENGLADGEIAGVVTVSDLAKIAESMN